MKGLALLILLLKAWCVDSHAYLAYPKPRNADALHTPTFLGERIAPYRDAIVKANLGCGGGDKDVAGPVAIEVEAGSLLELRWKVTVPHFADRQYPGVRIAMSYDSSDSFNQNILAEGVDAGGNYPGEMVNFTVLIPPGKPCEKCVLQWMWAGRNDNAAYINCVDIKINSAICSKPGCEINDPLLVDSGAIQKRWTEICDPKASVTTKCVTDRASGCGIDMAKMVWGSCSNYVEHVRRHAFSLGRSGSRTSLVRAKSVTSDASCHTICVYGAPSSTVDTCSAAYTGAAGTGSSVAVAVDSGSQLGSTGCPVLCPLPKTAALDAGLAEMEVLSWAVKDQLGAVNGSLVYFQSLLAKPKELEPYLARASRFLASFNMKVALFRILPKIGTIASAIYSVVDALLKVIEVAKGVLGAVITVANGLDEIVDFLRSVAGTGQIAMDRVKGAVQLLRDTVGPARHCVESGHPLLCSVFSDPAEKFSELSTNNIVAPLNKVLSQSNRTLGQVVEVMKKAREYEQIAAAAVNAIIAGQSVDDFVEEWQGKLDDVERVLQDKMCVPYELSLGEVSCTRRRHLFSWGNKKTYKISTPAFLEAIGVPSCTAEVKSVEFCFSVQEVFEGAEKIAGPVRQRFEDWAKKGWAGLGLPTIDDLLEKHPALHILKEALEEVQSADLMEEPGVKAVSGLGECARTTQGFAVATAADSAAQRRRRGSEAEFEPSSIVGKATKTNPFAGINLDNPFQLNVEQLGVIATSLLKRLNFTRELESVCILTVNQIGNVDVSTEGEMTPSKVQEFAVAAVEVDSNGENAGADSGGGLELASAPLIMSQAEQDMEIAAVKGVSDGVIAASASLSSSSNTLQCVSGLIDPLTGNCVACGYCDPDGKWCLNCMEDSSGLSGGAIAAIVVCMLLLVAGVGVVYARVGKSNLTGLRVPQWQRTVSKQQGAMKRVDTTSWLRESASKTDTI
jgi:hypothetical protein